MRRAWNLSSLHAFNHSNDRGRTCACLFSRLWLSWPCLADARAWRSLTAASILPAPGCTPVACRGIDPSASVAMTASPPPPILPLVQALRDVREFLYRAVRKGDMREVETAIERINRALDRQEQ